MDWHYAKGGKQFGPVDEDAVKALVASGHLGARDFVWNPAMSGWERIASVPQFAACCTALSPSAAQGTSRPGETGIEVPSPFSQADANRGLGVDDVAGEAEEAAAPVPLPFAPIPVWKVAVMTTLTLGIYQVVWFYRHWKCVQRSTGEALSPVLRAIFEIIFCYPLFRRVADAQPEAGLSPVLSTVAFVGLTLLWRLPDPWFLLAALAVLPLLRVQVVANRAIDAQAPGTVYEQFTIWSVLAVVAGTLFWLLLLAALAQPETVNV